MSWTRLVALCTIVLVGCTLIVSARRTQEGNFRCFRPFDALDSFRSQSMHFSDNCDFGHVAMRHASVALHCQDHDDHATSTTPGCYATMHLNMTRRRFLESEMANARFPQHSRFVVELRAVNHSTVSYKGFDGHGYDVCCDLLASQPGPQESRCTWDEVGQTDSSKATRVQRIVTCPLYREYLNADQERIAIAGEVQELVGLVKKPLHRLVVGPWEMKVSFLRNTDVVGRVVVPFELTEELAKSGMERAVGGSESTDKKDSDDSEHSAAAMVTIPQPRGAEI